MSVILRPIGLLKPYCRKLLNDQGQIELADREGHTLEMVCREIGLPEGLVSLFIVNGHPKPPRTVFSPATTSSVWLSSAAGNPDPIRPKPGENRP